MLAGLDGKRNLVATLARDGATYPGQRQRITGFTLIYKDSSVERYRSAG